MNSFLVILCATSLSGSVLLLCIQWYDKRYWDNISPRICYWLLKSSLLCFFFPVFFSVIALIVRYSYEIYPAMGSDITEVRFYQHVNAITVEKIYPRGIPIIKGIFIIWLFGFFSSISFITVRKTYHLFQLLNKCTVVDNPKILEGLERIVEEYRISKDIYLYQCPYVCSPFLVGILKLKIVIPEDEFSKEELEVIFRHELMHEKQKDNHIRMLVVIIQGINWFNPMIQQFSEIFYEYGELACDAVVSEKLIKSQKLLYVRLLYRLLERSCGVPDKADFSNSNEKFLKRRIFIIMKGTKIKRTLITSIIACTLITVGCPVVSLAASVGVLQVYDEILKEISETHSVMETSFENKRVEYYEVDEEKKELKSEKERLARGVNEIECVIPSGKKESAVTTTISIGEEITVMVMGENSTDSYKVGIEDSVGKRRYVYSEKGRVSHTFKISKEDVVEIMGLSSFLCKFL